MDRLLLISTPWPSFSRPSIQLGTLKAYLDKKFPGLAVETRHFYLQVAEAIGYSVYQAISERVWLAETVYASLLYPSRRRDIEKLFYRQAAGEPLVRKVDLEKLITQVEGISEAFIRDTDWGAFGIAGFSICLCQLTSALYFIKRIREKFPNLPIVIGGSMFIGESANRLLQMFPEVDFAVIGEGELPLSQLVHHLRHPRSHEGIPPTSGLVMREAEKDRTAVSFSQMGGLTRLPPPDYDEYFHLLRTFSPEKRFIPTLQAEISRGCWWCKPRSTRKVGGCAFCNLNRQWEGYRSKGPRQVTSEIDYLTRKYETLSVNFVDSLLPWRESREIFGQLSTLNKDLRLFGEIRASTPKPLLKAMRFAGMHRVQIGIEALSTRLLKKMNKGTTAIQNLEVMKYCEELGIKYDSSNLLLYFPGSDLEDVEETLRNIAFAMPFQPLRLSKFGLFLGSPVEKDPRAFGLRAVFSHPNYAVIFPPRIFRALRFPMQAYRGDLKHQRKLWRPVERKVVEWKRMYEELHKGPSWEPILSFRDGQDFLIIRQRLYRTEALTHRLVGTSRAIYLYCHRHRSLEGLVGHFSGLSEDRILPFLRMMVDKKLMFEEKGKYLSLAVPARPKV